METFGPSEEDEGGERAGEHRIIPGYAADLKTKADIVGGILLAAILILITVGTLAGSTFAAVMLTGLTGFLPAYLGILLATSHPTWGKKIAVFCLVLLVAFVFTQVTLILSSSYAFLWYGHNTAVGMAAQGAFMGFAMATLHGLFRTGIS